MKEIVVAEPLHMARSLKEGLTAEAELRNWHVTWYDTRPSSQEELAERLAPADMAIIASYPLTAAALEKADHLSMLSVAFSSVDHIDVDALKERNVSVSNCAGYSKHSVTELTICMAIALLRNVKACDSAVRNGRSSEGLRGRSLHLKEWGIIGTGEIGRNVARLAVSFRSSVIGYSRHRNDPFVDYMPLEEVLKRADVLSIHVPLTAETKHLIGEKELALMKPSAILINTSRGPVVDNAALAKALTEGRIAGAGIDVYDTEPPLPADDPLLKAPNTILTPHIGFDTKEAMNARADMAFENLVAFERRRQKRIIYKAKR